MPDLLPTLLFGGVLLVGVGLGEALRAGARWSPDHTRRLVHAWTGVAVALCPPFFSAPTGIYVLAALFVGVNLWAIPRRVFPGMHGTARRSWGTVTFPLALLIALVGCWSLDDTRIFALQTAFLVLAVADPLASLVGQGLKNPRPYQLGASTKSVAGSLVFFGAAWALTWGGLVAFAGLPDFTYVGLLGAAFVVAALATAAEALGTRGWDNFAIVVAVATPLVYLHTHPDALGVLLLAVGVAAAFGGLAWRARFLDNAGAVAASLLAFGVFGLGGWAWALPSFTFFLLSSLLSKWGRVRKAAAEAKAEKGSRRDAGQVYANGGVAGALLVAHVFWPAEVLFWGFVGAFAAAAADTWATEIGTFFRASTRSIWTLRPVPPGTSGGVSLPGTLGAVAGAGSVFLSLTPPPVLTFTTIGLGAAALVTVGGGLLASLVDSVLGGTVQALYRDRASGDLTERASDHHQPNDLVRGQRWITNDRVNLACTLAGAALAMALVAWVG